MFRNLSNKLRAADEALCAGVVRGLVSPLPRPVLAVGCAFASLLGAMLSMVLGSANAPDALLCAVIILLWCVAMLRNTQPRGMDAMASLLLLVLLFAARMAALPVISPDCRDYLLVWADVMHDLSFPEIMARRVGDYTVFYQYFVYILARLPFDRVVMYKAFSMVFEALLAWSTASLACSAQSKGKDSTQFRMVFIATLALPTVVLNAAVWAQCDAIYAALVLAGAACCLKEKPVLASICFGFSLCVKLQAIFLLPIVALLLFWRKLSLRHTLLMAASFTAAAIPAMLGGKSFKSILSIYLYQMHEYKSLVLSAPSIFSLIKSTDIVGTDALAHMGVILAMTVCIVILYLGTRCKQADGRLMADVCFALSICIPFLLPYMHERYFFLADVLSIVYAVLHPRRAFVPLVVITASLNGYAAYLLGGTFLPWNALVPAMAVVCAVSLESVYRHGSDSPIGCQKGA